MRFKNKITRERNRVSNGTNVLKEQNVLYFTKDLQVSSRILAVLSVGVSKNKVNKSTNKVPKTERYRIICGSNGKIGTWYSKLIKNKLTDKEFVELFPKQCSTFQKIFEKEYNKLKK